MNIALVHDWLTDFAGSEKVVLEILKVFPSAPVYTSIYDRKKVKEFEKIKVYTTYLQKLPLSKKFRSFLIPLMPLAFEQFDFSGYDLVISSSTSVAKGIITRPGTCHISYCNTPTRYLWEPSLDPRASDSALKRRVNHKLRIWDIAAAARVDYFLANSKNVKRRIQKYYRRDADVIYPPVDIDYYNPKKTEKKVGNFYLFVGRLIPYKRADLVVEAFNKLGRELRIIGSGSEEKKLKTQAKENIKFLGRASDKELYENLKSARAVVFPSEEDFGIVPVESMACGTPVIAYGAGGAAETVIPGITGEFFSEQTPEALIKVIKNFKPENYKFEELRRQAEKFSAEIFRKKFKKTVEEMYTDYRETMKLL